MNSLLNIFFGVPQSKYAGIAVLISIVLVSIILLFSEESSNKFTMFLILLLISLPSIALSLLQLTCIVTGSKNKYWWCNIYAWILCGLIIFYAIYFIIYALLFYNKIETFAENPVSNATSNVTNMYESATEIPNFVKNNSLTFADVLNSR